MKPEKIVTTYDGTEAQRKECRYIKAQYYIKNKQCFYIDNEWNRINNGKIIFDYESERWIKKSSVILREGVVGIDANNKIKIGFYTPNPLKNVTIGVTKLKGVFRGFDCISEKVALKLGLEEAIIDGNFYETSVLTPENLRVLKTKIVPRRNSTYRFPFEYSSGRMIPEFTASFNKNFKPEICLTNTHRLKFLEKYTWGIEFETTRGTIPERFLWANGLIACRDGSITGFEYVTIPLSGAKGIEAIYNDSILLRKYTDISYTNALHIHVGGYPINMKSVIAIYRLGTRIQNEIFSMFPSYYSNTAMFKGKDYCNPLRNISSSATDYKTTFLKLYEQVSGGYQFEGFNLAEHPMDRSGRHKWNVNPRYKYLNIIPLLFGSKKTVEFRVHTPTLHPQKVIYWLFIIIAILEFARIHQNNLIQKAININTSLERIVIDYYKSDPALVTLLLDYIKLRKSWFSNHKDVDGKAEIFLDNDLKLEKIM